MNANLLFTWLRDPRYAPEPSTELEAACFLPVEIVGRAIPDGTKATADQLPTAGAIEIDFAGVHRLRIVGTYDPAALALLIRGLFR